MDEDLLVIWTASIQMLSVTPNGSKWRPAMFSCKFIQAYVQATLNQWYVADLFRHFLELRIVGHCTSLCGFGIAEDEVSVKAGVATHLRFPNPLAPVSDTSPKKYIGSIHLGVPLRYDRGIRLISIAPSICEVIKFEPYPISSYRRKQISIRIR